MSIRFYQRARASAPVARLVAAALVFISTWDCASPAFSGTFDLGDEKGGSRQNMPVDFFEVLLKWNPSGPDPHVREWLERQGLTAMPMKAGMLTVATRSQIEKLFGVSVEAVQPPLELRVPEELRSYVSSVTVLKPRSYH